MACFSTSATITAAAKDRAEWHHMTSAPGLYNDMLRSDDTTSHSIPVDSLLYIISFFSSVNLLIHGRPVLLYTLDL